MESQEINSASTMYKSEQDVFQEETEESIPRIEAKSNSKYQDEKDDLGPNNPEENSVVTLASPSETSQTIKVYLRLKPFPSETDLTREQEDAYTILNSTTLLTKFPGLDVNTRSLKNLKASERVCRTFTFTTAFGADISQMEFFDEAIKPQIGNFLAGQSSTVMSYGTSNAGKSYTLYGAPSALGIIPLSINLIFCKVKSTLSMPWYKPINQSHIIGLSSIDRVRELDIRDKLISFTSPEKTEFINAYQAMQRTMREEEADLTSRQDERVIYSVWLSFAEIYNDTIYDLLSTDWPKKGLPLKMVTDKQGRTFIKDLRTVYVNSDEEAYQILLAGQYRSRVAATTLNSQSSRSHCIFTMKLLKYCAESAPEDVEISALSFCDLAGSGRLKMTTNITDRIKETQNINTSLLVLGRCLKSIWEGQSVRQKSEVVGPFRDSKLTRLFQKALSGKEQITLIVNVNPMPSLYAETQNVLNFSAIAKKIIVEPVNDIKKKMFTSRFSRVVSQSVKTVTDWDHAAAEDSTLEICPEKVKMSDYIPREYYDDMHVEYEQLKKEYADLKTSMIDKDLETREEMANTYTGLINDLEANWRIRSQDVEEQQEHLLAWSVNEVENFYKEKLNRLNSRKRRRWDDGDAVDDREANMREMEAENASLTAKILVTKETIKELRSARENAFADKNKAVFELSLVKEEIIGVKKMLEAAENDIRSDEDGAHFMNELKRQLSSREERIKNLKEFLNEAKEEYIRITSDAGQMHEELKEANATLIENSEKIEDLEEQLDQSNVFVNQRTKEIEQLTEKLRHQSKQLTEFEERAKSAEEKLKESESIRLNLIGAVEDLQKLQKVAYIHTSHNSNYLINSLTDSEMNIGYVKNITELENTQIFSEINNIVSENSPTREDLQAKNLSEIIVNSVMCLEGKSIEIRHADTIIHTDESVDKENKNSFKVSYSSGINDSGIAVSMGSANQTMEQLNLTVDVDFEAEDENIQTRSVTKYGEIPGDKQVANSQLQQDNLYGELSQELENAKQDIAFVEDRFSSQEVRATNSRHSLESIETEPPSVKVNVLERELQFADIIALLENKIDEYETKLDIFRKGLATRMDKEQFYCECLNDKVSRLEKQLSEVKIQVKIEARKCFNEYEVKIEKIDKELSELKEQDNAKSQSTQEGMNNYLEKDIHALSELKQKVKEFEIVLAKCQTQESDQRKLLLDVVERLSLLEGQIQNYPIPELETTTAISILDKKLKDDLARTIYAVNPDSHRSKDLGNRGEPWSKENTESNANIFKELYAFDENSDDEKFQNHVTCSQRKEVKRIAENTIWGGGASSITIDRLIAPTSTPRGSASHSDAKPMFSASLNKTSISLSNSVVPVEENTPMIKKKVSAQASRDDINSQSKRLEIMNASKYQNVRVVRGPTKKSEKLSHPVQGKISPSLKRPTTIFTDKSSAAPLMGSRWASRKTKPLIQKNDVYVEPEPKREPVIRNRKPR